METALKQGNVRLRFLDGLRGLATLAVFFQHFAEFLLSKPAWENSQPLKNLVFNYFNWGRFGVVLFFLLSGYLISLSLNEKTGLARFAVRRFFRLYPAFWLSVGAAIICNFLYYNKIPTFTQVLANLSMLPSFMGEASLLGLYWTLMIELIFYSLCGCLFFFRPALLKSPDFMFLAIVLCCTLTLIPITLAKVGQFSLPIQYLSLHLSMLLLGNFFKICHDKPGINFKLYLSASLCLISVAVASGFFWPISSSFNHSGGNGVFFADILAIFVFQTALRTGSFHMPTWLLKCGDWSYSIYLFHWPIILFSAIILPSDEWYLVLVLSLASTILFSRIIFVYLESPFIALGRRVRIDHYLKP
jgi:peptidoglycan/LPS O-acetylase OafA/YrhL